MKTFLSRRRVALLSVVFCFVHAPHAQAQSAGFEPLPVPPPHTTSADRTTNESDWFGQKRKDHLSLGALVGVGFPRPLAAEGVLKIERAALLGFEYSALPRITVSQAGASASAVAGDLRVFPLRGPFFVGLRMGEQHIEADATVSAYGYTVPATLSADTLFLNPRLGFLWTWEPGISLGVDAGVQIPLSTATASALPASSNSYVTAAENSAKSSLESAARLVGNAVLPTVDLLQVGILF